ncbi:MAG: manganese efflux pump MntP family protein [Candidatus Eisenbacteria bacterium]|uniref:Putative manganese efflux pump MntP n=1 Tax=Eiseniibacteriota bacterium TaxID=2212470 RepID=A0A948RZD5_UNCEI|nr:manganese efflux pump MntP family protein [Candidatus Eisenbacteria bacterium]MBU1950851.1 manganese efflux pump MntP family protein [Candidatus Eisenbacteria bacterium]MBU2692417.1 manganese efflux pump MntP family protein [Candidatus Eisenbacteria bacterium]
MVILEIIAIAIGLSLDAVAVSLAAAAAGYSNSRGAIFRLAFHFGLFQALMPLIGWLIGEQVVGWAARIDHWIAFGLLAFVGFRMIRSGWRPAASLSYDPTRGKMLVLLSLATSIDALAVGLSLAMVGVSIVLPCLLIGLVTATLSLMAIYLGSRIGARFGKRMEIAGGIILVLIGLRILVSHFVA